MNLRQLGAWGQSRSTAKSESDSAVAEQCLTLLARGAVAGVPAIDAEGYRALRSGVEELALQLAAPLPDEERLALIRPVVREFESYRSSAENALREQLSTWRDAVASLLSELLADLGIDSVSPEAAPLLQLAKRLTTAEEIKAWCAKLNLYLHPLNGKGPA